MLGLIPPTAECPVNGTTLAGHSRILQAPGKSTTFAIRDSIDVVVRCAFHHGTPPPRRYDGKMELFGLKELLCAFALLLAGAGVFYFAPDEGIPYLCAVGVVYALVAASIGAIFHRKWQAGVFALGSWFVLVIILSAATKLVNWYFQIHGK